MDGQNWLRIISESDDYERAFVPFSDKTTAEYRQCMADAKLYAAAPAMAELLEVIADAANDTLEDDGPNGFAEETQKRARALLTKIKGTETK